MQLSAIPELPQAFVQCLEECGLKSDVEFLSTTVVEILRNIPPGFITRAEIGKYKEVVAKVTSAPGLAAGSLLESTSENVSQETTLKLPSSLATFSHILSPHSGRVVELSGHRESRKFEFILNIVLRHLAENAHGAVHWVDTTGDFPPDKASNIASRLRTNGGLTCLERIQLSLALEIEQLYDVLDEVTPPLAADDSVLSTGYLVIDNISSLLGPLLSATSSQGHALMVDLMHQLKLLAQRHLITVINTSTGPHRDSYGVNKKPALGPTFAFLTDATLWIAADKCYQPTSDMDSRNEDSDIICHIELLKSNFTAAITPGSCILTSGLYLDA